MCVVISSAAVSKLIPLMTSKHNPTTTIGSPCTTVRFFPAAAQDAANQLLATYTSGHAITWYVCFILSFLYIAHSRENFLKNSEQQWSRFSWPPLSFHFDQCWHAHQQCTLWCFFVFVFCFGDVMWCGHGNLELMGVHHNRHASSKIKVRVYETEGLLCGDIRPDGQQYAVAGMSQDVEIVDVSTSACIAKLGMGVTATRFFFVNSRGHWRGVLHQ